MRIAMVGTSKDVKARIQALCDATNENATVVVLLMTHEEGSWEWAIIEEAKQYIGQVDTPIYDDERGISATIDETVGHIIYNNMGMRPEDDQEVYDDMWQRIELIVEPLIRSLVVTE